MLTFAYYFYCIFIQYISHLLTYLWTAFFFPYVEHLKYGKNSVYSKKIFSFSIFVSRHSTHILDCFWRIRILFVNRYFFLDVKGIPPKPFLCSRNIFMSLSIMNENRKCILYTNVIQCETEKIYFLSAEWA